MPFNVTESREAVPKSKVVVVSLKLRLELVRLPPDAAVTVFRHKLFDITKKLVPASAAGLSGCTIPPLFPLLHVMRKSEEIEGSRLVARTDPSVVTGMFPELDDSGLLFRQFQMKLPEPFAKLIKKPMRFLPASETDHKIIGISHQLACSLHALPVLLKP